MVGHFQENLKSHEDTSQLRQNVGSGIDAWVQLTQVGYHVYYMAWGDDKEI